MNASMGQKTVRSRLSEGTRIVSAFIYSLLIFSPEGQRGGGGRHGKQHANAVLNNNSEAAIEGTLFSTREGHESLSLEVLYDDCRGDERGCFAVLSHYITV